jgi:hypothetical protein
MLHTSIRYESESRILDSWLIGSKPVLLQSHHTDMQEARRGQPMCHAQPITNWLLGEQGIYTALPNCSSACRTHQYSRADHGQWYPYSHKYGSMTLSNKCSPTTCLSHISVRLVHKLFERITNSAFFTETFGLMNPISDRVAIEKELGAQILSLSLLQYLVDSVVHSGT